MQPKEKMVREQFWNPFLEKSAKVKDFLRLSYLYLLLGNYKVVQSSIESSQLGWGLALWHDFIASKTLCHLDTSAECSVALYYIVQKPVVLYQKSIEVVALYLLKKEHM